MNKKELVDALSEERGMSKKESEILVDTVFELMIDSMVKGDKVLISGFGTFNVNHRKERKGVSPKTLKEITIPASNSVSFKPSNILKDKLN